jgi:Flp pilus assembly protein TadG
VPRHARPTHPAAGRRWPASWLGFGSGRGQALVEFALVVPFLLLLLLAIGDFARLYSSEITVEAAAREAADYGAFAAGQWDTSVNPSQVDLTVREMVKRACTAASNLPDYVAAGDSTTLCSVDGSNPLFSFRLEDSTGNAVANPPADCGIPVTDPPCVVHVTMAYTYHTFFNVPPYPSTISLQRDSRFAISDLAAPSS